MIQIGPETLPSPVLLAPMAGISDRPYRELVASYGAGLVVSEMVATAEMLSAKPSMRAKAEIAAGSVRTSVQLAGREPDAMAETARLVEGMGARIVDINMGCPARKVTSGASGSALMREPDRALRIIEAVARAVDVPVTLKMRLGWDDDNLNAADLARSAESAGVRMIVVHGRTRCQFYKGHADWAAIRPVVEAINVPVIANGDIVDAATAREALRFSGAAGVMVGRGARGRPWALAGIDAALRQAPAPPLPVNEGLFDVIAKHYSAQLSFYGSEQGVRSARKHLAWYLEPLPGGRAVRDRVVRMTEPGAVLAEIEAFLGAGERLAA